MREQRLPDYDVIDLPEDAAIVLVGQPDALQGELRVYNPGEEKLVLRDARVRSEPLRIAGRTTSAVHTLELIVLRPGQVRHIPMSIAISPHTPPGEYQGELEVAGRIRPIVLHVTEVVQLDISPPQLVIENRAGEKFTKSVVFTNKGNVSLTIGEIGPVVLDDELMECRVLRAATINFDDQGKSVSDYLVDIIRQSKAGLEQAGLLRVHNTAGTIVLQPGEVRLVDLEIRVPDKLERHARYFGVAALYTSNLEFVIVPTSSRQPSAKEASSKNRG
jgi:hypothetical protein